MPRPGWNGRRVTQAVAWVYHRDQGTCWLCGHTIAWTSKSLDHVLPASQYPELDWSPTNWRAAHRNQAGTPHGCTTPGCTCIGNTKRKAQPHTAPPTRDW